MMICSSKQKKFTQSKYLEMTLCITSFDGGRRGKVGFQLTPHQAIFPSRSYQDGDFYFLSIPSSGCIGVDRNKPNWNRKQSISFTTYLEVVETPILYWFGNKSLDRIRRCNPWPILQSWHEFR